MKCLLPLAAVVVLVACRSESLAPGVAYEFTDLTNEYTRFWDRTQALEQGARVAAFETEFGALFADFYGAARFDDRPRERVTSRIVRSFDGFPAIRAKYQRISASFDDMIQPAMATFRRAFPDMQLTVPVYLLHSLGEMDGGTRTLGGRLVLIFGADVMARVHDFEDEQPFLHHELFHVYHNRRFLECEPVWCALWVEGLAVYAAKQLNPAATDSQLLLTVPEPIRGQVDAHMEEAICAVKSRLDSSAAEDLRALFSFSRLSPDIPPRAGYYIGYLVARNIGANRPIGELGRLSQAQVRPLIEQALGELASCKALG